MHTFSEGCWGCILPAGEGPGADETTQLTLAPPMQGGGSRRIATNNYTESHSTPGLNHIAIEKRWGKTTKGCSN